MITFQETTKETPSQSDHTHPLETKPTIPLTTPLDQSMSLFHQEKSSQLLLSQHQVKLADPDQEMLLLLETVQAQVLEMEMDRLITELPQQVESAKDLHPHQERVQPLETESEKDQLSSYSQMSTLHQKELELELVLLTQPEAESPQVLEQVKALPTTDLHQPTQSVVERPAL